jgi:TonB family protein
MKSALHPAPKAGPPIHINPQTIRQLAPPEVKAPVEAPTPTIVHEQPKDTATAALPPPSLPVSPQPQPVKPAPQLEPLKTDQPPTPHGLILPNTSAGHTISQAISDAAQQGGGGSTTFVRSGRMPGSRGGGYGGGGGGGGQASGGLAMLGDTHGVNFDDYNARLVASVYRNWMAIMPESALMGDQGVVVLRFRIFKDGTVVSEEPILMRSSSKTPLDRAAMGSIRASSPFEPLPPQYSEPSMLYEFTYYYNIQPPHGR